ncbi:transmembrane protein 97 [Iris pallida]|uniref:Transmembrane protein 97 n=1 Tax=Iris pallida TaxID=29817 RepID=A0AAX6E108_IRIPA|nr:transmembrane protein 97 [Iris pallida]KAJ6835036.1 transmembrane protein 97 [Iris pallida]
MGLIGVVVDAVLVYFSVVVLLTVPLVDSQCALPASLYPDQLVRLKRFFEATYDDYMFEENTPFFVGIVWMEIFFLWPLCLANIYGLVRRKSWVGTTLVMVGVAVGTAMATIYGELLLAGRASEKLVQVFIPFVFFSFLATLRGLFPPRSAAAAAGASRATPAEKKRA